MKIDVSYIKSELDRPVPKHTYAIYIEGKFLSPEQIRQAIHGFVIYPKPATEETNHATL